MVVGRSLPPRSGSIAGLISTERYQLSDIKISAPLRWHVVVDYHNPSRWHPLHLVLLKPILRRLEPFSPALWQHSIREWLPAGVKLSEFRQETFFGGLYQKVAMRLA